MMESKNDGKKKQPTALERLESKLVVAQDKILTLNRDLKAARRESALFQALADELPTMIKPLTALPEIWQSPSGHRVEETVVLHLSDAHADEVVQPEQVGGLERYNIHVACCRGEKLVDSVLKWCTKTMSGIKFDNLVIFANGDHVVGEIHDGKDHSQYQNTLISSLAIGQLYALMIRDLAPFFKSVNVLCLSGNHGRRTVKKNYNGPWDNFDYLVHQTARIYCRDIQNVTFEIPNAWTAVIDIKGHKFAVNHGDNIKSWMGIPWYGIERRTRRFVSLMAANSVNIQYFCFGHFHTGASLLDLKGETLLNGAWLATDAYSFEAFSGYREPSQLLHGVHAKHGVTWRLPLKIKDDEAEKKGPQRYHLEYNDDHSRN